MLVGDLRHWAGIDVAVRLRDGSRHEGRLRTELLSNRSLSVFLMGAKEDESVTLYIDQIVEISPLAPAV
jgi:predicted RNA-binding protein with TRAM domain